LLLVLSGADEGTLWVGVLETSCSIYITPGKFASSTSVLLPGVAPAFPLLGHGTSRWVHRGWLFTSRCPRLCL